MKRTILLFFLIGIHAASTAQPAPKKNVLFIIADDLNTNIGAYDHYLVKTPNIDRLADEGLLFLNAFSNFPLCGPSRVSFMTGLYPDQSTIKKLRTLVRDRLPDVTTMSQNFMNNGYTAARVGKIYHYNNPKGIGTAGHDDPASWQHTVNPIGRDKEEEDQIFSLTPGKFGATLSWLAADGKDEEQTDGKVATEAIKLLNQYAKEDTPFFLGVGFYKPHTPFVAPKKYFDMYSKDKIKIPEVPNGYLSSLPKPAQEILTRLKAQNNLSEEHARSAIQAYYACVSFLDAQVGRVLEALEQNGLKENTIIVFTSDHGYHLGEHGYYQKRTLFEDSGRVPLIISYPGQPSKGKETKSLVEMIDFYPTLSELVGIPIPLFVSGESMVPILENPRLKTRETALTQLEEGYTLRTEHYRYTRWLNGGEGMIELYDRRKDPAEMDNLAGKSKYNKKISELDKILTERIKDTSKKPKNLTVIPPEKN
jgi:iduronate 2-sulfatase